MKTAHILMALALVGLTACKVIDNPNYPPRAKKGPDSPETVMVTYYVQPGHEAEFPGLLAQAWQLYLHEHLVRSVPHVVVRQTEADGKTKFVEIFSWVNHAAPNKAIASIQNVWAKETAVCEDRNGHHMLEGGEVELATP